MALDTRELFARLIQCEAGGEGTAGMQAVATVIMNRATTTVGEFARVNNGGDVRAIITQPGQFVCMRETIGGRYNAQNVYNMTPTQEHYDIVDWALDGGRLAGVSYCATCDGAFYQGKVVAVIGGGDTALEDALYLSRMAKTVYLVHRRDTFRANAALQEAVQKTENIVLVTNAVPTEITGEKRVETLKLLHGGSPEELLLDGVFVAIGSVPNTSLLEGVAELDSSGYVQAGEDGRTSVEGLFAAGDVRTKALRQVITAAADGANCVASAEKYLLENRG